MSRRSTWNLRARSPWLLCALVASTVLLVVGLRVHAQPIQPYGLWGAEWIEHAERLRVARCLQLGSPEGLLACVDGPQYPPLLHLLSWLPAQLLGSSAADLAWTGLGWLLLLAAAMALVARSLGAGAHTAAAAFCGTLLVPGLHGAATRYHYDLPMTALLWLAVALLLALPRPILGGSAAGLAGLAAALVKWTALPFGACLLLGAALTGRAGLRPRLLRAGSALAVVACGSWAFQSASSRSLQDGLGMVAAHGAGASRGLLGTALAALAARLGQLDAHRLLFYPLALPASVLSGMLGSVALALLLGWLWRGPRRGLALVLCTVLGQGAFLLLVAPVLDERFLLTLTPALVLAAAMGWAALPASARGRVGALALLGGLWVAADLHHGQPGLANRPLLLLEGQPQLILRGLGAGGSTEARGWSRADQQRADRAELRAEVYGQLLACRLPSFGVTTLDPLDGGPPSHWWRYRALLAEVEGLGPVEQRGWRVPTPAQARRHSDAHSYCETVNAPADSAAPRLVLAPAWRGSPAQRPACLGDWTLVRRVQNPDSPAQVAIWTPTGSRLCP